MENKQLNLSEPENIMGTMDVNPLLIKLSIPMMISMLVQALYNVVDSIFVARVSENALTAVSLAFSLQNMMFAVGIGTGVGVNALLSKSLGEKNQSRANKTAENGLFLALCSYLVFLVLGLTVVRPYFYAQTADADIAEQGSIVVGARFFGEMIRRLPDGYDSDIGEGGNTLSTGEKQLISFARVILADPRIFVLDEATSSIDTETEQLIQDAITTVLDNRTSFIVAHRLSTIRNADRILVIRGGEITEQGTHSELIAKHGYYYDLYTTQFREEASDAILSE